MSASLTRHRTRYPGLYYRETADGRRSYLIVYRDALGKQRQKQGFATEKEALLELGKVREKKHLGSLVSPSKLTVEELADRWLRSKEGHVKASTMETYTDNVDNHIIPKLGHLRVQAVGPNQVAAFVGELKGTHAAWTIHGILTALRGMFRYAVKEKLVATNPVDGLERSEKPSGFTKKVRCLDEEEIAAVIRESTDRFRVLFTTLLFTGMRISEALALELDDLDWASTSIHVRGTKTEAADREVAIPLWLMAKLAGHTNELSRGDSIVFTTSAGKPMNRRVVAQAFKRTLTRAKVAHASLHDCRHTFASILIGQGEDVTYVADQLGHKDPGITLRTYLHLFQPEKRRQQARERLEAWAGVIA